MTTLWNRHPHSISQFNWKKLFVRLISLTIASLILYLGIGAFLKTERIINTDGFKPPLNCTDSNQKAITNNTTNFEAFYNKSNENPYNIPILCNLNATNINLPDGNLTSLNLEYSHIKNSNFKEAILELSIINNSKIENIDAHGINLQESKLISSNFIDVRLLEANLSKSKIHDINFIASNLKQTNFTEAKLYGVNFNHADLTGTNFKNAEFFCITQNTKENKIRCPNISYAKFSGPQCKYQRDNDSSESCDDKVITYTNFAGAKNIINLVWDYTDPESKPTELHVIRKQLREKGYEREAREITYVLEYGKIQQQLIKHKNIKIDLITIPQIILNLLTSPVFYFFDNDTQKLENPELDLLITKLKDIFFNKTVMFGLKPMRAIELILKITGMFAFIYFLIIITHCTFNIQCSWLSIQRPIKNRINSAKSTQIEGESQLRTLASYIRTPRKFVYKNLHILVFHSLWFSLLTLFHFGWRDLNLGVWLSKLQLSEFNYQTHGLIRFLAGLQSLFGIPLLVIFALTLIGDPWT